MTDKVHIGEVIRYFRKSKKMTQAQLADGICSTIYLRYLESGTREPTVYIVSGLSKKLNVNLFEFFEEAKRFGSIETYLLFIQCSLNICNLQKFQELIQDSDNTSLFETLDGKQLVLFHQIMTSQLYMERIHLTLKAFRLHFENFDFDQYNLISQFSGLEQNIYIDIAVLFTSHLDRHDLGVEMLQHYCDYCYQYLQYEYTEPRRYIGLLERCCYAQNALISDAMDHESFADILDKFETALAFCNKYRVTNCIADLYVNRGIFFYQHHQDYELARKDFAYSISMAETFWSEEQVLALKRVLEDYPLALPFNL